MRNRLFTLGNLMLMWILTSVPVARSEEILLLQEDAYLPYMAEQDFEAVGIYSDILDEAAKRLSASAITVKAVPWSRALKLVRSGGAQGLVGTYYRPVVRPWIRVFSVPLLTEQVFVFCRDGIARADWNYPADFKGLTFGNNTGYRSPGQRFFELVEAGEISVVEARTTAMNLNMLALGRIDCYVQERLSAEREIRRNKLRNIVPVKAISAETAHIGYSSSWTGPEADAFIIEMDRTLTELHRDGSVDRIISTYLNSS